MLDKIDEIDTFCERKNNKGLLIKPENVRNINSLDH